MALIGLLILAVKTLIILAILGIFIYVIVNKFEDKGKENFEKRSN